MRLGGGVWGFCGVVVDQWLRLLRIGCGFGRWCPRSRRGGCVGIGRLALWRGVESRGCERGGYGVVRGGVRF